MASTNKDPGELAEHLAMIEEKRRELQDIGFVLRGTILKHSMKCGTPGCRCRADPPVLHGPYYDWTRKVRGKTVTVRLKEEEAKVMMEWIANGRKLNKIVGEMFKITFEAVELIRR